MTDTISDLPLSNTDTTITTSTTNPAPNTTTSSTTTENIQTSTPIIPNIDNYPIISPTTTTEMSPVSKPEIKQAPKEQKPEKQDKQIKKSSLLDKIPDETKNIFKKKYNSLMDTNKSFIRRIFDNTRLNPYQCKPDGLLCDPVIIYIILMTVALVFLYIFRYQLKSKLHIAFDWILISIIFTSGLLILVNLCLYKKPSKYSIPIIIIALFALYFVIV